MDFIDIVLSFQRLIGSLHPILLNYSFKTSRRSTYKSMIIMRWTEFCSSNTLESFVLPFFILGYNISYIALTLLGSILIPLWLTINPNNFLIFTPNVHFDRFNLSLYFLNLLKKLFSIFGHNILVFLTCRPCHLHILRSLC